MADKSSGTTGVVDGNAGWDDFSEFHQDAYWCIIRRKNTGKRDFEMLVTVPTRDDENRISERSTKVKAGGIRMDTKVHDMEFAKQILAWRGLTFEHARALIPQRFKTANEKKFTALFPEGEMPFSKARLLTLLGEADESAVIRVIRDYWTGIRDDPSALEQAQAQEKN